MKRHTILAAVLAMLILAGCHWIVDPNAAPPLPVATPEATAIAISTEEAPQVACEIKANVGSNGDMVFHLPGGVYYDRVKVDLSQGDFWACTEQEAIDKGFRKSSR